MKVTVTDIKEAILRGAESPKEVYCKTLYGTKCGACIKPIDMIIEDELCKKHELQK